MNDKDNNDKKDKKTWNISVDQKPFDWTSQFITGLEVKTLVHAPATKGVWLKIPGPNDDLPVADTDRIDLGLQQGREHFFTGDTQTTEG